LWDSRIFYALTVRNRVLEISNAQEGTLKEQWWRLQHRSAHVDEQGRLMARALDKNPMTGTWEFGEDNLRRFLFD
ncbi:C6 zinc finger domain-containing protein, partial [Colletotrichum musicola]